MAILNQTIARLADEKLFDIERSPMSAVTTAVTEWYLSDVADRCERDKKPLPSPHDLRDGLFTLTRDAIEAHNDNSAKGDRWRQISKPDDYQVEQIVLLTEHIVNVRMSEGADDEEACMLAVYVPDGPDAGTYRTSERDIRRMVRNVDATLSDRDVVEVMGRLRDDAPIVGQTVDPDLVPVNNGVFDYRRKELLPFSPDYVFLSKSHVDYNPEARDVEIPMPGGGVFSVRWWVHSLTDDREVESLIWQLFSFILRPHVAWNKTIAMYSETGNNGKGTLALLLRNLLGAGAVATIPVSAFDHDFMLSPLVRAQAVITDENKVGTYLEDADNFKAIVTHDPILVNRKHKDPVVLTWHGVMVQCFNEMPRMRDRTESVYRRMLFIPFNKCFKGREIKEIKQDYLQRKEVLEYVMYRALNSNFYELANPRACADALEAYKEYNDPVRDFYNNIVCDVCSLNAYDFGMLYEIYKGWSTEVYPMAKPMSKTRFVSDILSLVESDPTHCWYSPGRRTQFRVAGLMSGCEPLLLKYNLRQFWRQGSAGKNDLAQVTDVYVDHGRRIRGIIRSSAPVPVEAEVPAEAAEVPAEPMSDAEIDIALGIAVAAAVEPADGPSDDAAPALTLVPDGPAVTVSPHGDAAPPHRRE